MCHYEHFSPALVNIPGTCWNCRGVWLLAPETGICHTLSPWEGRLGFTPAGREWCRAPGSAAQPAEAYEFGLGAASHCLLAKYACFPHSLQPPPQNPTFCHLHFFYYEHVDEQLTDFRFMLSQLHFRRWQYSSIFKKKKLEVDTFWKFSTKMLCISFNISCIIHRWKTGDQFKPGAQLGYSETFRMCFS